MARPAASFRIDRRRDGVAVVTFDVPGASVNTLSTRLLDEVEGDLAGLLTDPSVRALVLASGKPTTFIAGADLSELGGVTAAAQAEAFSHRGHVLLDRLASSPKPVVAAIHGAALGGGLEVALACSYLLASDDPATVLALPEVMLGLLPGGGGTQRLPRRIGLPAALPLLLTGARVRASKALRLGLVDALTTPGRIAETAARAALALANGELAGRRPLPRTAHLLTHTPLRLIVLAAARRQVRRRTRGLYPAPPAILRCVATGLARGVSAGQAEESRLFGALAAGREAHSLIFLFHASNALKKAGAGDQVRPVSRLGVVGGGFMGAGVASVSLPLVPVVVRDISPEALARCARGVHEGLAKQVRTGAITPIERDRRSSRLRLTTSTADLAGCDLVIEAVFEDLELKRRVLAELEEVVAPTTVLATNTSALPIAEIAATARHPERMLGLHYFSPVHKMPLLELVTGRRTAPWAVAVARAFGIAQGKTVIVVRDGPGFFTTRILGAYLNEAMLALEQGAVVEDIDRALRDFGFPVGPLALIDEVGIDVAAEVATNLSAAFASRGLQSSPALPRLVAAGCLGRKNLRGFYVYPPAGRRGRKRVNHDVYTFFGGSGRPHVAHRELAGRLSLMMVNEAARCLEEGIIASASDGDVGAVMGLGFPPFRGGPFHHVDAAGAGKVQDALRALAERHGARFAPALPLVEAAKNGTRFFGE